MKNSFKFLPALLAALALAACSPSNIQSEESAPAGVPEDVVRVSKADQTERETMSSTQSTYSIPADAPTGIDGGPGVMQTNAVNDKENYPADKQGVETLSGTSVCLYVLEDGRIAQLFSNLEICDASSLISALVANGVLATGTEVQGFEVSDGVGTLRLNQLAGTDPQITEEKLLASIGNTFTDNLRLTSLKLLTDDKDYGELTYTDKYDAT